MIGIISFKRDGSKVFAYEFVFKDNARVIGQTWADGIKDGIEEFRRAHNGHPLYDVEMKFSTRP